MLVSNLPLTCIVMVWTFLCVGLITWLTMH